MEKSVSLQVKVEKAIRNSPDQGKILIHLLAKNLSKKSHLLLAKFYSESPTGFKLVDAKTGKPILGRNTHLGDGYRRPGDPSSIEAIEIAAGESKEIDTLTLYFVPEENYLKGISRHYAWEIPKQKSDSLELQISGFYRVDPLQCKEYLCADLHSASVKVTP